MPPVGGFNRRAAVQTTPSLVHEYRVRSLAPALICVHSAESVREEDLVLRAPRRDTDTARALACDSVSHLSRAVALRVAGR